MECVIPLHGQNIKIYVALGKKIPYNVIRLCRLSQENRANLDNVPGNEIKLEQWQVSKPRDNWSHDMTRDNVTEKQITRNVIQHQHVTNNYIKCDQAVLFK